MTRDFKFEATRGDWKYTFRNDGNRAIASAGVGTLFFPYKDFELSEISAENGVLMIGHNRNRFEYEGTQSVREEIETFRNNFTDGSQIQTGEPQSSVAKSSAKANSERRKGVAVATSVSAMTKFFMALALIGSIVLALQKDQLGEVSSTNVGFGIGIAAVAVFQGLFVLMIAQYAIAKLSD